MFADKWVNIIVSASPTGWPAFTATKCRFDASVRYMTKWCKQAIMLRGQNENLPGKDYWTSAGGYPGLGDLVLRAVHSDSIGHHRFLIALQKSPVMRCRTRPFCRAVWPPLAVADHPASASSVFFAHLRLQVILQPDVLYQAFLGFEPVSHRLIVFQQFL